MKKLPLLLLLVFGLSFNGFSQNRLIKGKVTDDHGKPLAGASINIKNTATSTLTDSSGNFELPFSGNAKAQLVVTFVGFLNTELSIGTGNYFDVQLKHNAQTLNDVIVVGYGTQRKKDVTGAISSVKADEFAQRPIVKVEQALQGTAPGVAVQSSNGMPGNPLSVRIRGTNSITGSNEPLYVIDGYIGGSIASINPGEIESMEILKDASAGAIYGSRASNGVVIITTKSGHEGAARINVNAWFQKAEIAKDLDLMDAYDFANTVNIQNAAVSLPPGFTSAQLDGFKTNPGTDWQKALQQKPLVQNYEASVSGGSQHMSYFVSFNYLDQPGLILNQYYKKGSLRSNLDFKINDKLDLKFYLLTAIPSSRNTAYVGDTGDPFSSAAFWDPTKPVYDPTTGKLTLTSNYGTLSVSPVAQATNQAVDANSIDAVGTGVLTYHILKNLTFTSSNSYESQWGWTRSLFGLGTSQTVINGLSSGYASGNTNWYSAFQTSNFLTYGLLKGDHSLTLTGLWEYQLGTNQNINATASNLSTYALGYYNLGLGLTQQTTSGYSSSELQSFMGRLNYSYKDKYLLTASIRDDGSSRLTTKYSTFPSVAVGWNISRENFMENSKVFSSLKLRGSYGETGNQGIPPYSSIPVINTSNVGYYYDGNTLSISTPLGTPVANNLVWETTLQTDIGIDASFLNNRVNLSVDAYNKKISNLLFSYQTPAYLGGGSYQRNIGSIQNRGIEIGISGTPLNPHGSKLKWTTWFEISFNDNKVLNLNGLDNVVVSGIGQPQQNISILKVGAPLGEFTGYQFLGTWKTSEATQAAKYGNVPGDAKYTDVNGDGVINQDDYLPIGNGIPKMTWGFINDFSYGNFTLNFMFAGQNGAQIFSQTIAYTWGQAPGVRNATLQEATQMWTPKNETNVPAFSTTGSWPTNSSRFVYNANFIKLKNLSLNYSIPQSILGNAKIRSVDVYISGQNLFTITKYPGYDPELTNAQNAMTQGVEMGVIPNARTYTIGFRVGF
ncbi:MAG TPA: TonB-dependent receptor [Puia sp.]|jgi:TonB-linked SusC/RagA family outer membrane protein|nr:TonB-dependent receptor [Puia sp.]